MLGLRERGGGDLGISGVSIKALSRPWLAADCWARRTASVLPPLLELTGEDTELLGD